MDPQQRSVEDVLSADVVASSRGDAWPGFDVMTARLSHAGLEIDGLRTHTLALNVGRPFALDHRIDGRRATAAMPAGALKLVAPGLRSSWHWDAGDPIEMLHVSIDDDVLRAAAAELDLSAIETRTAVGFADAALAATARELAAELHGARRRTLVSDALRIELLLHLIAGHSSRTLGPGVNRVGPRTLRLIDAYVEAHLASDITIAELAALAGMSRFHFARIFRLTVGTTPYQYVLERRLERARGMLRTSDFALRDIAAATGFADQSHFTRLMKRRYGVTPGALRASRSKNVLDDAGATA